MNVIFSSRDIPAFKIYENLVALNSTWFRHDLKRADLNGIPLPGVVAAEGVVEVIGVTVLVGELTGTTVLVFLLTGTVVLAVELTGLTVLMVELKELGALVVELTGLTVLTVELK